MKKYKKHQTEVHSKEKKNTTKLSNTTSMILHPRMEIWANGKPPLGVLTGQEVTASDDLNPPA